MNGFWVVAVKNVIPISECLHLPAVELSFFCLLHSATQCIRGVWSLQSHNIKIPVGLVHSDTQFSI